MAELVRTAQAVQMECVAAPSRYEQVGCILGFLRARVSTLGPGLTRPAPVSTFACVATTGGGAVLFGSLYAMISRSLLLRVRGPERQEAHG